MWTSLHVLRTLALAFWVGSIAFFAFGVAPVAFHVLPTSHEAGLVVSGSLHVLHTVGVACGVIFLVASLAHLAARPVGDRRVGGRHLAPVALVLAMVSLTAYSALSVLPRMERDRIAAGGVINDVLPSVPARADFDRLHHQSEQVEGGILMTGVLALTLITIDASRLHPDPRGR